jgi:hypothetical protein
MRSEDDDLSALHHQQELEAREREERAVEREMEKDLAQLEADPFYKEWLDAVNRIDTLTPKIVEKLNPKRWAPEFDIEIEVDAFCVKGMTNQRWRAFFDAEWESAGMKVVGTAHLRFICMESNAGADPDPLGLPNILRLRRRDCNPQDWDTVESLCQEHLEIEND